MTSYTAIIERVNSINGGSLNTVTTLLANTSSSDFFVSEVYIIGRTLTTVVAAPIISLGTSGSVNNVLAATAIPAAIAAAGDANPVFNPLSLGVGMRVAAGQTLSIKITTAASAAAYLFDVIVVLFPSP